MRLTLDAAQNFCSKNYFNQFSFARALGSVHHQFRSIRNEQLMTTSSGSDRGADLSQLVWRLRLSRLLLLLLLRRRRRRVTNLPNSNAAWSYIGTCSTMARVEVYAPWIARS
jgi:hypothetical protein